MEYGTLQDQINLQNYKSGIYFIIVESENSVENYKIIKQ